MKEIININKMQNGITSNSFSVASNCICPYDGAIAQHFNGDGQILSTDRKEVLNPGARRTIQYH